MSKPASLEIVICTEKGALEEMSCLLVASIRSLPYPWNKTPIYSYQPRKSFEISDKTRDFFKRYNVHFSDFNLNQDFIEYPLANKPIVCAYHESVSKADRLLFIDSDTIFINPPVLLEQLQGDVKIRPVDLCTNKMPTDKNFSSGDATYWSSLYKLLKIERRETVISTIDNQEILEYYNSGFVCVNRKKQVFSRWLENFKSVMAERLVPDNGQYFVEQTTFSATVAQMNLKVDILPKDYNFPVSYYIKKWRGFYPFSLGDRVHIHYHKLLRNSRLKRRFISRLEKIHQIAELLGLLQNG